MNLPRRQAIADKISGAAEVSYHPSLELGNYHQSGPVMVHNSGYSGFSYLFKLQTPTQEDSFLNN